MEFYGTIGPACAQLETLQRMVEAGMTGIRMNLSHGPLSAHKDWLDMIHAVGIPQLLIDLQGPELRIGTLPQPLVLEPGQSLRLGQGGVPCPAALVHAARPGQDLLLDDGRLLVQVAEADGAALQCTVVRGGTLQSRKSLAAPGLTVASPTLTEEDLQNLQLAGACGVTGVMLPFVRGAEDIRTLRRALEQAGAGQIRIFAKIESLAGVQALPEFLPLVDETAFGGLPICRGALYGGDPDAGQYVQPGGPHPRRGQRHLQRRSRRRFQRDAHRGDRRRAVPGGGHGVSCAHCPHRLGITQSQRHSVDLCCRI